MQTADWEKEKNRTQVTQGRFVWGGGRQIAGVFDIFRHIMLSNL